MLKCGSFNSEAAVYRQSCASYLVKNPDRVLRNLQSVILAPSSAVFYLIFLTVTRSEYLIQLFQEGFLELIFTLTLWSLFLIFSNSSDTANSNTTSFRDHELHESLSEGIYVRDVEKRIIEIVLSKESKRNSRTVSSSAESADPLLPQGCSRKKTTPSSTIRQKLITTGCRPDTP